MPHIRLATAADAQGILNIYAPYIKNTSLTFETEIPSVASFGKRIADYLENWPWLVCEIDGIIAGYAYGSRYRERMGYQWCVECSAYIHDNFLRAGIGSALYKSLFDVLKLQGYRNVYAVINLPNDRSVTFHEKMGFQHFATYENVGYKLGKWKNVGWWQLVINEYNEEPSAPKLFAALNKQEIQRVLSDRL
ncbi:MAG: N-acetyltransferase family protein [Chitinophagaceae bacterium]